MKIPPASVPSAKFKFRFQIKIPLLKSTAQLQMGKKVVYSQPKKKKTLNREAQRKETQLKKYQSRINSGSQEHSPISKNSDTAIFYGDSEECPSSQGKSSELRKAEAIHLLGGSEAPSEIKYRDKELIRISKFVRDCQRRQIKGCRFLMVTGAPGLGKTLSINNVLKTANCKTIAINANISKTLRQIQNLIFQEITGKKSQKILNTQQMIRQLIVGKHTNPVIIYIQEIQTALNNFQSDYAIEFLNLFSKKELNLCLIGVSNSIDALQRYNSKIFNLYEVENLVFSPYNQEEIASVMIDRFLELKVKCLIDIQICDKLLRFTTRKLQNITKGDLRMVNEFIKEIVSDVISQREFIESEQEQCKEDIRYVINIDNLQKVFRKIENSKQNLIESLPFTQQLLLVGINAIIDKQQLLYVSQDRILSSMSVACEVVGLSFCKSKIKEWLKELECYSLIKIEERKNRETRITLKVNSKDIKACEEEKQKYLSCFLTKFGKKST